MRRKLGAVVTLTVLLAVGFTVGADASEVSNTCFDGNNTTELGHSEPGIGGVGFEADHDSGNNADVQHVCYRVYDPLTGDTLVGGVIKPYQYGYPLPGAAGGVQCLTDSPSVQPTPFCYMVYGFFTGVSPSGAAVSGWAGETGTSHVLVELTNVSVSGIGAVTTTDTATTLGVGATTPDVCAVVNGSAGPFGTCTGTVAIGASVTKDEIAPRSPLGVPTGVDPDDNPSAPLATVTIGSTTEPVSVPASCIGIC